MTLAHISLTARDADRLAAFYETVFGCRDRRPRTTLSGPRVGRGNGLPGSEIYSIWLSLPGVEAPFLELHQYLSPRRPGQRPQVGTPGFGHLAFTVADLDETLQTVLGAGGAALGEIAEFGPADAPTRIAYVRDPEGNILELEQRHRGGSH
ncbi:MAG: VOC family protein [Paracoccaceae bacterium]